MHWLGIVFLVVFALLINAYLTRVGFENNQNYEELLRFFSPDGKFTVPEIAEIIKERTSGRRDISDKNVRMALEQLHKEGKLCKEINHRIIVGRRVDVVRYSLPVTPLKT